MTLADFILAHETDDPAALMLARDRWPDIDISLAAECIAARRKLKAKVPEWYANPGIICPSALSAEQCSSTATARYKALIACRPRLPHKALREKQRARLCPTRGAQSGHCFSEGPQTGNTGPLGAVPSQKATVRIADLTGGIGVDCWQFSKVTERVLYNEMNPILADAVRSNFALLGCSNVDYGNVYIDASTLPELLDSFMPDIVFMDPARRDAGGRKVFLPEDCSPNVLELQDIILSRGIRMIIKLSPMADISLLLKSFHCVKEMHVVQADGECKELLLVMEPGFGGEPDIVVAIAGNCRKMDSTGLDGNGASNAEFRFRPSEEKAAVASYIHTAPQPGDILFEPGPALSKSGAFKLISARYGLQKLGPDTHLFTKYGSDDPHISQLPQDIFPFGKFYTIVASAPFGKSAIKDFATHWPDAEVKARALPLSSDALRARMKLHGGGSVHIFGAGTTAGRLLLACSLAH